MPVIWARLVEPGRWQWGRDDDPVGYLVTNEHGGIEADGNGWDPDLVTALLVARHNLDSVDTTRRGAPHNPDGQPAAQRTGDRTVRRKARSTGETLGERAERLRRAASHPEEDTPPS